MPFCSRSSNAASTMSAWLMLRRGPGLMVLLEVLPTVPARVGPRGRDHWSEERRDEREDGAVLDDQRPERRIELGAVRRGEVFGERRLVAIRLEHREGRAGSLGSGRHRCPGGGQSRPVRLEGEASGLFTNLRGEGEEERGDLLLAPGPRREAREELDAALLTRPAHARAAPVMIATASVIEWVCGVIVAARLPSRCTWMRSATSNTCGMLCEMRITGIPRSRRFRMSSSTWLDSRTPSAAVGSSSTTTFEPKAAARATATACR